MPPHTKSARTYECFSVRLFRKPLCAAILSTVTLGLALSGSMARAVHAAPQQAAPQVPTIPLAMQRLKGDVYWSKGFSNNGFIIGKTGVIVFDTRTTLDQEREELAAFSKISNKPITHVVLSHSDGDHVNGLPAFPKGVTIVAQKTCKQEMEDAIAKKLPGAPSPDYLPTKLIDKDESLTIDGVRVRLLHFAPAHTGGDLILYLPDQKIVFTGDILISEIPEPFLHMEKSGSPAGWIETMKGMVALDADTFVAGHGDPVDKAEMRRRLAAAEERVAKVTPLVAQGKSLESIKQVLGEKPNDPLPGGRAPRPSFTDYIYQELTKK